MDYNRQDLNDKYNLYYATHVLLDIKINYIKKYWNFDKNEEEKKNDKVLKKKRRYFARYYNCNQCINCMDKPKNGGIGKRKKACILFM